MAAAIRALLGGASELSLQELTEVVQEAWLSQASPRRAAAWLAEHSGE